MIRATATATATAHKGTTAMNTAQLYADCIFTIGNMQAEMDALRTQRDALLAALKGAVHCLAWHVEDQGRGVAMDAEFLRKAREAVATVGG